MYTLAGCLFNTVQLAALMEKETKISDVEHKIHVSTRLSLVHDWRVASFAVARHKNIVRDLLWKANAKSFDETMNRNIDIRLILDNIGFKHRDQTDTRKHRDASIERCRANIGGAI